MTSIRNLPLAARLGGAFGALCVALAIVAFAGLNAIGGLSAAAQDLGNNDLKVAEVLGNLQERTKDEVSLAAQHLYVLDGDLAAQDRLAEHLESEAKLNDRDLDALRKLTRGTAAAENVDRYAATVGELTDTVDRAVELSRTETIKKDEDRDGSRTLFTDDITKLDEDLEQNTETLVAAAHEHAREAIAAETASAASGKRIVLIVTLLAVLAAVALAAWVTRSVVAPVKALGTRMKSLDEHCLQGLCDALSAVAGGDLTRDVKPVT
ncbi:MAG TPA: MCP four helix bundle domain-containing protein, partial [Solirubrobacter sp.]|nr:MCP four helix bundle domain-containing protein [Solirubrobacter sp.]